MFITDEELAVSDKNLVYLLFATGLKNGYFGYSKKGGRRLNEHELEAASEKLAEAREKIDFSAWGKKTVYSLAFKAPFVLLLAEHVCITLTDATRRGYNTLAFDSGVLEHEIPLDVLKYLVVKVLDLVCPRDPQTGARVSNGTRLNERFIHDNHEAIRAGFGRCKLSKTSMLAVMNGGWLPWIVRKIMKEEGAVPDIYSTRRWPTPLIPGKKERDLAHSLNQGRKGDIEAKFEGWHDLTLRKSANHHGLGKQAASKVWPAGSEEWWKEELLKREASASKEEESSSEELME